MDSIFLFCPSCKQKLSHQGKLIECSACGFHYYLNPAPCNAMILENEHQEILFVVRKYEPQAGFYDLPGGFVEIEESFEDAMNRELKEELSFVPESMTYLSSYPDTYRYRNVPYTTLCTIFYATVSKKQVFHPADDITGTQWIHKDTIPYDRLAFPSLRKALEDYRALRRDDNRNAA